MSGDGSNVVKQRLNKENVPFVPRASPTETQTKGRKIYSEMLPALNYFQFVQCSYLYARSNENKIYRVK